MLHLHPETLRGKAVNGEVPGAKINSRWLFIKQDLFDMIRNGYNQSQRVPLGDTKGVAQWSEREKTESTTSTSCGEVGEYEKALGLV